MGPRVTVLIATATVLLCTATANEAIAQTITITPANPTISVGQTQQFTVPEVSGAISVEAGDYHACILLQNGEGRCSGFNTSGQLGNGTITNSSTPVPVVSLSDAVGVTSG